MRTYRALFVNGILMASTLAAVAAARSCFTAPAPNTPSEATVAQNDTPNLVDQGSMEKPLGEKSPRVEKQLAGANISPDWVEDPSRAAPYVKEVAEHSYQTLLLFVRYQKRTVADPAVRDAVRELVSVCHRHGLKAMLDTDPTWWAAVTVERHPEAALHVVTSVEATCRSGVFSFNAPLSLIDGVPGTTLFSGIPAAFRPTVDGFVRVPNGDLAWNWTNTNEGVVITGNVKDKYDGKLVFYVEFKAFALADLAHPAYLKAQQELLDMYHGIPLDGLGWDEPGKCMGSLSTFKTGEGFTKFFQTQNGYSLADHLIWLDHGDGTAKAVKVRCDYYRTLSEMNYLAQKEHNDYASRLLGKNLMFGTHQTWAGVPRDLAGGVMDYFKLGQVSTAAWTDGSWDCAPLKYQAYNFTLAESLKKELGRRDAYYNDYGAHVPAVENMRFANRFKMLYHINWWNIWFSDSAENILTYRQEPLRAFAKQDVANLDTFDAFVDDRFFPQTDVAILYAWESIAACPKWLADSYYMMFLNLSLCLADSGLFGAEVSTDGIGNATIEKGTFAVSGHRYRLLVVPYGVVLSHSVYRKIMQMCAAGVPVFFLGPPPAYEVETGNDIAATFAEAAGFKPFSFAEYTTLKNEWVPARSDFVYPVSITSGKAVNDREGRIIAVRSPKLPLWYMPGLDPREDLINCIAPFARSPAEVFAEGTYYRFFTDAARDDVVIVVAIAKGHVAGSDLSPADLGSNRAALKEHAVKALFRFPEGELTVRGGSWVAVCLEQGRVTSRIGDCPDVRWTKSK